VLDDHKIVCWGYNNAGQLGLGDLSDRRSPTSVNLGTGRTALGVSNAFETTCALLDTSQMTCWGDNGSGELGMGDIRSRSTPGAVVNLGTGRSALAVANAFLDTCALLDNHQLKCWGWNNEGVLGYGDTTERHSPANATIYLGSGRSAQALAMGEGNNAGHICVVLDSGDVKCWGDNDFGELGYGDTNARRSPANAAVSLGSGRTAKAISTGYAHTCALLDNGTVSCWGHNSSGQVGSGDSSSHYSPTLVSLGTGRSAVAVHAAGDTSCAILDDGDVKCWGNNSSGELGLGDILNRGNTTATVPSKNPVISF
jgi:alpha-tubulin suppressor-like RCC1 family protein